MGFISADKLSFDDAAYVQKVRNYIDNHPNTEEISIAKSLGIPLTKVNRIIKSLIAHGYIVETDS